eukprot:gnl/MRDRNA2_/MRDRNA2_213698_c0_seq1.p1 gnl/MRDRNA2_/MRDRNA2_213698_c0~~gnl/MRDRNA2_/MRDRNA2_213698_c0_seq1.p1  ORF type:complete len:231 (+),score=34.43 gnl/MRDRNA2_/MRDRNA2_213698_c0_seq1:58-693(+)
MEAQFSQAQGVLDRYSSSCGCECIGTEQQVNAHVVHLEKSRKPCTDIDMSFHAKLRALSASIEIPSIPDWVNAALTFVVDLVASLKHFMKKKFCAFSKCASVWDLLFNKKLKVLFKAVKSLIIKPFKKLLDGICRALGLPTVDVVIQKIAAKIPIKGKIPNVNLNAPEPPNLQIAMDYDYDYDVDTDLPTFSASLPGCTAKMSACALKRAH